MNCDTKNELTNRYCLDCVEANITSIPGFTLFPWICGSCNNYNLYESICENVPCDSQRIHTMEKFGICNDCNRLNIPVFEYF